jgi:hypothetical protein
MAFFGGDPSLAATAQEPATEINWWRIREREYVLDALSWANLGWPIAIWLIFRPRAVGKESRVLTLALVAAAGASLVFWSLATWGPNETVVTHSAYAVDLVLFAALGFVIANGPEWLAGTIVLAQCCDFLAIWIVGTASEGGRMVPGTTTYATLFVMAAATIAIMVILNPIQKTRLASFQQKAGTVPAEGG